MVARSKGLRKGKRTALRAGCRSRHHARHLMTRAGRIGTDCSARKRSSATSIRRGALRASLRGRFGADADVRERGVTRTVAKRQASQPKLCEWVEQTIKEALAFPRLPRSHRIQMRPTNVLDLRSKLRRQGSSRTSPTSKATETRSASSRILSASALRSRCSGTTARGSGGRPGSSSGRTSRSASLRRSGLWRESTERAPMLARPVQAAASLIPPSAATQESPELSAAADPARKAPRRRFVRLRQRLQKPLRPQGAQERSRPPVPARSEW